MDISVVTRVTEQCNLDCSYCYMAEKVNKKITKETLQNLFQKVHSYNERFAHYTWIGGEPLLVHDDFFEWIMSYSNEYNPKKLEISHSIQTNGYLLSAKRRETLTNMGFKIGVSYDGTTEQEILRPLLSGKSSHKRVLDNIKQGNGKLGIINVITKKTVGNEERLYSDLKELTKSAALNFYAPTGKGLETLDELLPSKKQAGDMMIKFYELWRDDEEDTFYLKPFSDIVRSFFTGFNRVCEFSTIACYQIIGLDTEGKIYTCTRATHMPEAYLGDINKEGLEIILSKDPRIAILDRYFMLKDSCEYFRICGGGCPVEAVSYKNNFLEKAYYCCESRGALFKKIEEDLKNDIIHTRLKAKVRI